MNFFLAIDPYSPYPTTFVFRTLARTSQQTPAYAPTMEDELFSWKIIGHYRYYGPIA